MLTFFSICPNKRGSRPLPGNLALAGGGDGVGLIGPKAYLIQLRSPLGGGGGR
jgi:hypothetical protein